MDDKQINKGIISHVAVGEDITIPDLNDDCLESIFEYIQDLKSQIQLAKCSQRFCDVVKGLWIRQSKHRVLNYVELRSSVNYSDRKCYLTVMRTEIHTIKFDKNYLAEYLVEVDDMGIQCFPCVERCEICGYNYTSVHDDAVYALSKLLPNLKYLKIPEVITGKYLSNFQYLEELHLYEKEMYRTNNIKPKYIRDILLSLQHLKVFDIRTFSASDLGLLSTISQSSKLEVLKLDSDISEPMLKEVLQLPELKQLIVRIRPDQEQPEHVCQQILKQKRHQIQGIVENVRCERFRPTWVTGLDNLLPENLKFLNLTGTEFIVNDFKNCQFARLEILCVRHSKFWTADILEMLRLCPVLKCLDISFRWYDANASLLKDIWNYWHKENPNKVLCIYYYGTHLEREIEKDSIFWDTQKHLKLIDDVLPESACGVNSDDRELIGFFF